jgi:hypothetical protein
MITITVDVKPYIKEYLVTKYNHEPILATHNNVFGQFLYPLLKKPPRYKIKKYVIKYPMLVELLKYSRIGNDCKIPSTYNYLSQRDIMSFRHFTAELFYDHFFTYLDIYLMYDNNITKGINGFLDKYEIVSASLNQLQKSYYRYRKGIYLASRHIVK